MRTLVFLAWMISLVGGCTKTQTTTLSMRGIDCASCAEPAMKRLREAPGVLSVAFDRPRAEITVRHQPHVEARMLAQWAVEASQKEVVIGAGLGAYLPVEGWPTGADVQVLKGTESVLKPEPGKVTVFDFYATWCGPCRVVDAKLRALVGVHPELAVRKLDMGDWGSPVAEKYMSGVTNLPYVQVFARDGHRVAAIEGLDLARLEAAIEEASR